MAQITTQDIIRTLEADMAAANDSLLETAPDRFNRTVMNLIQKEIKIGKEIAQREQHKEPDSRMYVHYGRIPLAIYKELSPSFLKELELIDIYLYRKDNLDTAMIKIVFRF